MPELTSPRSHTRARLVSAVLWGGLIAGTLDITDALIFHGVRGVVPWRILQAIASGLLGRGAFTGGAGGPARNAESGSTTYCITTFTMRP